MRLRSSHVLLKKRTEPSAALADLLCIAVEGEPWAIHAQTKKGIQNGFPKVVEALSYSFQKYQAYKNKSSHDKPVLYGN